MQDVSGVLSCFERPRAWMTLSSTGNYLEIPECFSSSIVIMSDDVLQRFLQ